MQYLRQAFRIARRSSFHSGGSACIASYETSDGPAADPFGRDASRFSSAVSSRDASTPTYSGSEPSGRVCGPNERTAADSSVVAAFDM